MRCGSTIDELADPISPIAGSKGVDKVGTLSATIQKFSDLCMRIDV